MPDMPIDAVPVGALLSRPVYGPGGVLLAAAGTRLTALHLQHLEGRGVRRVMIAGLETSLLFERLPTTVLDDDQLSERLALRLSTAGTLSPFMRSVTRAAEQLVLMRAESLREESMGRYWEDER